VTLHIHHEAVSRFVTPVTAFSSAFSTIQSSSPRIIPHSFLGSVPRLAAIEGSASAVLSRVLGRGASAAAARQCR
jgi:hypothetical protein